jgi:hypothetical protein
MTMNAWYCRFPDEPQGVAVVTAAEWNDEVIFVVRDGADKLLAKFWLDADQASGLQELLRHQFGSTE